ncbi:hypothetical protein FWF89_03295 [Candidatus Saccharibacteria bacterium]|nr:hypothetical protein [Candidatus Saccharibacteria bacterium]
MQEGNNPVFSGPAPVSDPVFPVAPIGSDIILQQDKPRSSIKKILLIISGILLVAAITAAVIMYFLFLHNKTDSTTIASGLDSIRVQLFRPLENTEILSTNGGSVEDLLISIPNSRSAIQNARDTYDEISQYDGITSASLDINSRFRQIMEQIDDILTRHTSALDMIEDFSEGFLTLIHNITRATNNSVPLSSEDLATVRNYKPNTKAQSLLDSGDANIQSSAQILNEYLKQKTGLLMSAVSNTCNFGNDDRLVCQQLHQEYQDKVASERDGTLLKSLPIFSSETFRSLSTDTQSLQNEISSFWTEIF